MRLICGDNLVELRNLPDNSVDLCFTSPPYEAARAYGIDFALSGQAWVDWCAERFVECLRVTRGLVAWVVEGQTRQFRYSATPAMLMADLHRRGVNLRKPPVFHRVGIPGSGGPDWLRNDYEFIVCATKGGKLPWSDNTAMGHPPKWAPGGAMTNQMKNGRKMARFHTKTLPSGDMITQGYNPPAKANPGNVIKCLHSLSIADILTSYAIAKETDSDTLLQDLRRYVDAQEIRRWWARIVAGVCEAAILQSAVQGEGPASGQPRERSQGEMQEAGSNEDSENSVQRVRHKSQIAGASSRRRSDEQQPEQFGSALPLVSPEAAQDNELRRERMRSTLLGAGVLLKALPAIQEVREPVEKAVESALGSADCSNLIRCVVGGGLMGSQHAHLNEAPFPEALAEFFVRSFCPPGGIVLDPHLGSGTTLAVAMKHGRDGIGIDIRESQIELTTRRLAAIKPDEVVV